MHAPRAVHACTFLDVNVNADVNNLRRVSIAEQVNVRGYKQHSLVPINRQSSQPTLSYRVGVNVDFSRSLVNVIVIVNVLGELRFAKIFKYQPHLIAGEVA